jgi:hypothetical protein
MFSKVVGAALVAAVVGLASSEPAEAQTAVVGQFYAGVNAGALIPESISTKQTGTSGGATLTISGDFNLDAGAAGGVYAGYNVLDWLALEGQFLYGGADFSSFKGTGTVTGTLTGSGALNFGVKGHIDTYTGLANALVKPLGRAGWMGFSPYLGGGAGFTVWNGKFDSFSSGGTTLALNTSHSETDFAADAIIGFDYAVTPQIAIGGRYQFLWVNLSNLTTGPGVTGSNSDFTGHVLTATATYHF